MRPKGLQASGRWTALLAWCMIAAVQVAGAAAGLCRFADRDLLPLPVGPSFVMRTFPAGRAADATVGVSRGTRRSLGRDRMVDEALQAMTRSAPPGPVSR